MGSAAQSEWDGTTRRRGVRHPVQTPLNVTVLRSGIPDTVPGRSVDVGEGGIAAVVAAEFLPGEMVGVEIRLPPLATPLRTRALVRHHDKLRLGMEFVGLSLEQQAAIRSWAGGVKAESELLVRPKIALQVKAAAAKSGGSGGPPRAARKGRNRAWIFALALAAVMAAALWWRWDRGWHDLESGLPRDETITDAGKPQAHVPAEVMQRLITHRVDPEYPAAARPAKLQGVIALSVIVGRDGSVTDVRALNGPAVLAQAATDALRWWRFEPYRIDGRPVVAETTVAVEFKP